jgi:hypothetical protein
MPGVADALFCLVSVRDSCEGVGMVALSGTAVVGRIACDALEAVYASSIFRMECLRWNTRHHCHVHDAKCTFKHNIEIVYT